MATQSSSFTDEARLPSNHIEANKSLRRCSREALISLAFRWLEPVNQPVCAPAINQDADPSSSTTSLARIRGRFEGARNLRETKKEILEAISTHWSAGLSLKQWALADEARIREETAGATTTGGMQWTPFKAELPEVDYGEDIAPYAQRMPPGDNVLRIKPVLLQQGLQRYLGPLVETHIHIMSDLGSYTVLRIVFFGEDASCNQDGFLVDADTAKTLYLAFLDVGNIVHFSPSALKIDGLDVLALALEGVQYVLAPSAGPVRFEMAEEAKGVGCRMLFGDGADTASVEVVNAQPRPAKRVTAVDKMDPEKRRKIVELRKIVRFKGADEDQDVEED